MNQKTLCEIDNLPLEKISLAGESLYPHIKITREDFPRLLVTRRIAAADDEADYFGAFLPLTGVRFWLEFINRTFRLRTCEIAIDGKFPSPCTQFYNKRCVAPCVESLCDHQNYLEMVKLVKLFLRNEREEFRKVLTEKIEVSAGDLEFEKAAAWRDILNRTNEVFAKKDWQLWLADAVDTFEIEEKEDKIFIRLVTQRGRKMLGKKVFVFKNNLAVTETLPQIIEQFYRFYAPQEIRLPVDFTNRKSLAEDLSKRAGHPVKFTIFGADNKRKTSLQALKRAKFDFDFRQIKPPPETEETLRELKNLFQLPRVPRKIEAFDAAHISGTDFVAAKVVWKDGEFLTNKNEFWLSDETSEPETLQKSIAARFTSNQPSMPDLILIDGGKAQLQAALKAVGFLKKRDFLIVCAVKPPQRHSEISHFIAENGARVEFCGDSEAMRVLLHLRDDAHELANMIHRKRRETSHFYELAHLLPSVSEGKRRLLLQKFGSLKKLSEATSEELENFLGVQNSAIVWRDLQARKDNLFWAAKPVIVPIRFDDANGDARDLQPLKYTKI